MIKSRELTFTTDASDMPDILKEAESFASRLGLSGKEERRFRLLVEETTEMLKTITGDHNIQISFIEDEKDIAIHLETDTLMNLEMHDKLISVSKSGKNESAKGILGKIREAFEFAAMLPNSNTTDSWVLYGSPAMIMGVPADSSSISMTETMCWSLSCYRENLQGDDSPKKEEAWDELEKSVVANLADDVRIGIVDSHVVMDVIRNKA